MLKLIVKIIGALIVAGCIFLASYLDKPGEFDYSIIFSIIAGILFLIVDPVIEFIEDYKIQKKRLQLIKKHIKHFNEFLKKYTEFDPVEKSSAKEIYNDEIDYNRREQVFHWLITNKLNISDKVRIDGIYCIALCHEIDEEDQIFKTEAYKKALSNIFEKYDFIDISEDSKSILEYYYNYSKGKKISDDISDIDYSQGVNEITDAYDKTYNLSLRLKLEKDQIEEFRKTLAILISRGKLNVQQIEKKVREKLANEISDRTKSNKAYLILANKYHKIPAVENLLNRFPGVYYAGKKPNFLPEAIEYLHTRIVYPPKNFQTPKEFLEDEIVPLIPDEMIGNGFISIIPIEGTEVYSYPDSADEIESEYIKQGFETITAYKTGASIDLVEFYIDNLQKEIKVDELLSVIPFNVFVPNLNQERKNFIVEHYEELKDKFNISLLSDWAGINVEDLKDAFINIDERRKKRLYADDNWEEVANKIITSAKKHREAITN